MSVAWRWHAAMTFALGFCKNSSKGDPFPLGPGVKRNWVPGPHRVQGSEEEREWESPSTSKGYAAAQGRP